MRLRTMLCIAFRRMAASDGRASGHPSRRKPSPYGRRLAPQDEVGEPGNDWFHGIVQLVEAHRMNDPQQPDRRIDADQIVPLTRRAEPPTVRPYLTANGD